MTQVIVSIYKEMVAADFFDRLDGYYLTKKRASVRNSAQISGTAGQAGIVAQETGDSNVNFSAEL